MKLAILTDIHEDYTSLKHAIRKIEKKNCDKVVCLGDISGYSVPYYNHYTTRDAHQCLQLIRNNCEIIIIGNHDLNASKRIPSASEGFKYPDNWFELDYHQKKSISNDLVWLYDNDELNPLYTKDDIEFISSLPEHQTLNSNNYSILFSHYIFPNITGSVKEFYDEIRQFEKHFSFMRDNNCQLSFCGHAHVPSIQIVSENKFIRKLKNRNSVNESLCIQCPSLVKSNRFGEFIIFDTDTFKLELIKI